MAEVKPFQALHYNLDQTGGLQPVISPPYDVIDTEQRAELAGRSPYNAVHVDLPHGSDPYASANTILEEWIESGALVRDSEDAVWVLTQKFVGPDGHSYRRHGFLARIRVEEYGAGKVRPHERTHPGPKEDRLNLTRATKTNLSPIFALYSDASGGAREALAKASEAADVWAKAHDYSETGNDLWRVTDPEIVEQIQTALAQSELLIADGHHRYETARVYAEEIGGEGAHRYVLACLVALEDTGLQVFPTHRLISGLDGDTERQQALRNAMMAAFDVEEVDIEDLVPDGSSDKVVMGYMDAHHQTPYRLTLKDQDAVDEALEGFSDAYKQLDTAVLEALLLKGALGFTDEQISHLDGLNYSRSDDEALELIKTKKYDACFFMGPTPIERIQAIAAAGENMPPKSTFFYPKVPTGLIYNPLY